jgi:P4 family phage/plasmid primase-like protien
MESGNIEPLSNSKIIPHITDYRDVFDFLSKHIAKKKTDPNATITNTRIGDANLSISGGSYNITDAEYPTFLDLYYRDVVSKNKKEYLTEKQREDDGPILVDLDLRHTYDTDERQYTKEHIDDMVDIYLEELKQIFQMDETTAFMVYIFEKPTVNRVQSKNCTKDGIHMLIGVQADHAVQQILRKRVMTKVKEAWTDLPLINTWADVFDEGISKGGTNWQLYGSRKPGNEKYKLTRVCHITVDPADNEIINRDVPVSKIDMSTEIHKLSVRSKLNTVLFMRNDFLEEYKQFTDSTARPANRQQTQITAVAEIQHRADMLDDINTIASIRNKDELEMMVNNFIEVMADSNNDYNLKTIYDYTMILPETYYGSGSYDKWKRVGWVLRNTSSKLLIVWIAFSAKSSVFSYSSIPDLCDVWRKFDLRLHGGLTRLSLIHWARTDAPEEYERVLHSTLDYYVEHTINSFNLKERVPDFDLANVLYQMYKHEYVCVSVTKNIWFRYRNNRWEEIDSGTSLRLAISRNLRALYNNKGSVSLADAVATSLESTVNLDKDPDFEKTRSLKLMAISCRLANTNDKKNIMTEAKELFYDGTFLEKMDTNPYLLCFNNGVVDFKENCFRKGQPEDIISLCTNIDYVPLNPTKHKSIMNEIHDFMNKLFPDKALCNYMWEHLASTLIGTSSNQTFNMYIGVGSNGKSVLMNLMEKVLGQYKGDVPTTLVTEKRGKVGGLAPEIVQLKGIRYAVMQEPSKGDIINEGMMKQLTSGKDPIQGRAPYMPKTISFIPQFKLAVACNALMGVKANDHGTWRRIRVVPFKSLFTETPVDDDPEKPHQFMLDKNIEEKFDDWKEVFAAMLVDIVFKKGGVVKDCDIVMSKSNEYRESQDYISEFIRDRITRDTNGRIKQMELNNEFSIWYMSNYGGRGPSPKELHEYMDKEYGRKRQQTWSGVRIKYERDELPTDMVSNSGSDDDDGDEIDLNNL